VIFRMRSAVQRGTRKIDAAALSFRSKRRKSGHTKYASDFASMKFYRLRVSQVLRSWKTINRWILTALLKVSHLLEDFHVHMAS
jgi:hypothetical protein